MKKTLILAAAAIAALSACTKEIEVAPSNDTKAPVFTATIEPETKTVLATGSADNKKKVEWLNTDQVFIYGLNPTGVVSVVGDYNVTPNAEDATSATLTPGSSLKYTMPGAKTNTVYAFYPASISYINANNVDVPSQINQSTGKALFQLTKVAPHFVLPNTQKYDGSDISRIAPMFGMYNVEGKIVFSNVTALLAITVPATECSSVKEIVVSSDQQMNGTFYLNSGTGNIQPVIMGTSGDGTTSLTLDCTEKYNSWTNITSGQSKTFYVSIPPQTYGNLKIDINKDGSNHYVMQTKDGAEINVERNKIYPINFAHTSTYGYEETEDDL